MKTNKVYSEKDVEILDRNTIFDGFIQLIRYRLRFRLYSGAWSEIIERELVERPPAVAILPYDPKRDEVILIEQYRIGAMQDGRSPWLTEIVGGLMDDPSESAEAGAKREVKEEAGLDIINCIPICSYWVSPGGSNERLTLFCGTVDSSKAGGIFGLKHEHEDIKTLVVKADEAFQMINNGIINNACAIIALQWLQLNRHKKFFLDDAI